jgi:hypothetical protein
VAAYAAAFILPNPLLGCARQFPQSVLLQPPSSATNDKTAACDAKPCALNFIIFRCKERDMGNTTKTVIVTGGSQGIGAAIVKAFLNRDCNVVAISRSVTTRIDAR